MADKAYLIGVKIGPQTAEQYAYSFEELQKLALSAGAEISGQAIQSRAKPDTRTFLGKGKVEEIAQLIQATDTTLAIINETISPSQQKHLEDALKVKVLDRVGLILDIFAQRAQTLEAKLQVELAQYEYLLPRLTRLWLHFSKQAGYIGNRGPGETQLEVDRRRIQQRIRLLKGKIAQVRRHHGVMREGRRKRGARVAALVGYTNAGKSTLLNALTEAKVLSKDQLFATLDPTWRKWRISEVAELILVDTVGFIRDLPHQLVEAFKATLDEVTTADLLLHVVDCSAVDFQGQINAVLNVLEEIKAVHKPMILVLNKQDLISKDKKEQIIAYVSKLACPYALTAASAKSGLQELKELVAGYFA